MNIIFAGTPDFSVAALKALAAAGHRIVRVLTQPDRPAGRGQRLTASPVKKAALELGLSVDQPETLKCLEAQASLAQGVRDESVEVMVVVAYGLILPPAVLAMPPRGCLNIHASLLPRWRGAAPIHRAIEAGDLKTGVGIMQMEAGLDTGPVLLEEELPIHVSDTTGVLHDRLAALGARLIVDALERLNTLTPRPQATDGVSYAHKIDKREAMIDWTLPATALARKVRAFDPFPGAVAAIGSEFCKIWAATPVLDLKAEPGTLLEVRPDELLVACGEGGLRIHQVQRPGGRRINVKEFLTGRRLLAGKPVAEA